MNRGSNMSSTRSSLQATTRLDVIQDIARRVTDDIRDIQQSTDRWGNEDWSDALADIGTLYQFAAAQMLYNNTITIDGLADRLQQFHQQAYDEARSNAEAALANLTHFGFNYTIADLTRPAIDEI